MFSQYSRIRNNFQRLWGKNICILYIPDAPSDISSCCAGLCGQRREVRFLQPEFARGKPQQGDGAHRDQLPLRYLQRQLLPSNHKGS